MTLRLILLGIHIAAGSVGILLGAYIAFVTAFSALNFAFLPTAVRWLWPTEAGTPGIVLWIRFYRRKLGREDPDNEADFRAPSPASAL